MRGNEGGHRARLGLRPTHHCQAFVEGQEPQKVMTHKAGRIGFGNK